MDFVGFQRRAGARSKLLLRFDCSTFTPMSPRSTFRLRGLLAAAGATCLVVASSASAGSATWNETAKVGGVRIMTYTVESLTVGPKSWKAHVAFRNVSKKTIGVGNQFGVAFFPNATTQAPAEALGFATATTFSTKLPKSLKPGASWSGVIGGAGQVTTSQKVWARVVFGPFTGLSKASSSMVWITDHAKALTVSAPAGQTPPATGPVI